MTQLNQKLQREELRFVHIKLRELMKLLAIALSLSFYFLEPTWLTNFEEAKTKAAESQKLILLNFCGSDWCAPCIRMKKEIFESPEFEEYAVTHLILVKADFPRKKDVLTKKQVKHNEMLAEKYNPEGKFPFTILIDAATGKILKTWDGLPRKTPEEFVSDIKGDNK